MAKTRAKSKRAPAPPPELPPKDQLRAQGRALRDKVSRQSQEEWKAPAKRTDPLKLLANSNQGRVAQLIPIRYGRMLQSPFTFYRGAAAIMAADLARTPSSGIRLQACGDCHLLNFGAYATPERRLVFDINDFDETAPAPWVWDLKRLAASFVIAGRSNSFRAADSKDAAIECVRAYREAMAEFAEMTVLDLWYASLDLDKVMDSLRAQDRVRIRKRIAKAWARSIPEMDVPKLVSLEGKTPVIRDNPPLIFHEQKENSKTICGQRPAHVRRVCRFSAGRDEAELFHTFQIQNRLLCRRQPTARPDRGLCESRECRG